MLKGLGWIHEAAPTTIEDPATIRVARECAEADPDGTRLRAHVQAATGRALPDDHKADALVLDEGHHGGVIIRVDTSRFGMFENTRIARCRIERLKTRRLGQFPGQSVLASTRSDQKHFHGQISEISDGFHGG